MTAAGILLFLRIVNLCQDASEEKSLFDGLNAHVSGRFVSFLPIFPEIDIFCVFLCAD